MHTINGQRIAFVADDLYYVHTNHIDAPLALTNQQGVTVWQARYTPFGSTDITLNTLPEALTARFPGQYADTETGIYYNYFRDYDPELGRYIQSDPIGLAGGINTYGYVEGNPVNAVDPNGLTACYVDFRGYQVATGKGFSLGLGHSGVVSFDNEGNASYADYGRFNGNLPSYEGNVRFGDLNKISVTPEGLPTSESFNKLKSELASRFGKDNEPTLSCADVDEKKVQQFFIDLHNNLNRPKYSVSLSGPTCKTVAGAAIRAGK